jgi:hypothetical protein
MWPRQGTLGSCVSKPTTPSWSSTHFRAAAPCAEDQDGRYPGSSFATLLKRARAAGYIVERTPGARGGEWRATYRVEAVRLDEAAVDHLLRALIDADRGLRAYAAYALRHVAHRDPRAHEALTAALQDEDAQVCRYAAESLQAGGHG